MASDNAIDTKSLRISKLTQKPKITPKYEVNRDILFYDEVIETSGYREIDKSIPTAIRQCWRNCSAQSTFIGFLPILQWLPKYSLCQNILGELISGTTVAIMNIPHGLAYGILAGVSIECGLYTGIFPVLVYMIFGTSRHISIGTFAVISLMTLKVIQTHSTEEVPKINNTMKTRAVIEVLTPLEVLAVLTLTTGLIHLAMAFIRLGTLAALLSEPLISGFTTGAACHVATSQLKDFLGVTIPQHNGACRILLTLIELCKAVPKTNIPTFIFCLGIMCFMILCNELVKPYLKKYCRMPFPAELIAVIGGVLISMCIDVKGNFGIKLVGTVPNQLPKPKLPRFELIPKIALDAVAIAIVSFSVVMSMGLPFAHKHGYEIRANQELIAIGMANSVSSCFSCLPLGCSLSRSVIQEQTGGVTQLASLVSVLCIILTVLWAGPFFSQLPKCVLAGVILVALKPLFMQFKDLKKFKRHGKLQLLTWIGTFLCVVIIDIDIGLFVGIAISIFSLYFNGIKSYSSCLGVLPGSKAIYVDLKNHNNAIELQEIKIFRYFGALNFGTSRNFLSELNHCTGIDEFLKSMKKSKQLQKKRQKDIAKQEKIARKLNQKENSGAQQQQQEQEQPLQSNIDAETITSLENDELFPFSCLIFDFSMLGHIDVAGCQILTEIMKDLGKRGVRLFFAAPTDSVYDSMMHGMALGEGPFEIFPTLHDAVLYADACRMA